MASKPLDMFYKRTGTKDGLTKECKLCKATRNKKWALENPDLVNAYKKKYREKNKDKQNAYHKEKIKKDPISFALRLRSYRKRFPDKALDSGRKWRKNNPEKAMAIKANRRAKEANANVVWANKFFILEAYRLAVLRKKLTGVDWHVDHIVPICGKSVCGLHVENNLRVIPAKINLIKSNKFDQHLYFQEAISL